jgi:hypothetical protein
LLCNKTLFKVFFSQKPHWIGAKLLPLKPLEDRGDGIGIEGNSNSNSKLNDKNLILTEIEA